MTTEAPTPCLLGRLATVTLLSSWPAIAPLAQVAIARDSTHLTVEAFANVTTGLTDGPDSVEDRRDSDLRIDAALRLLGWQSFADGPDVGVRVVLASSPDDRFAATEYSLLVLGGAGRIEIGERQGLPDVLTGYAPNNFTFTSAEFGPASGPSLDPAGTLQTSFLPRALAAQLDELTTLGFAASLSADESLKALYVSPKWRGFLAGLSYSRDAEDSRFGQLLQAGLTHERYWSQNVLRLGGSYSRARGVRSLGTSDLHSLNLGATLVIDDSLILGASVTWNGDTGLRRPFMRVDTAAAWGLVTSVNYNYGPWTVGAFYQWATSEGDAETSGRDRLSAAEAGISYRINTRVRFFGAYYYYDFEDEGGSQRATTGDGGVVIAGVRVTL